MFIVGASCLLFLTKRIHLREAVTLGFADRPKTWEWGKGLTQADFLLQSMALQDIPHSEDPGPAEPGPVVGGLCGVV